jgi:alanine racemase
VTDKIIVKAGFSYMINNEISMLRDTWVEINLDTIIANYNATRRAMPKNTRIAAVLKANAYGNGAVHVAGALIDNGVDMLAVACLAEAIEIRRKYDSVPILILGYTADEYLYLAVKNQITLTIFSIEQAEVISNIALELRRTAKIHIKIDTGFNRFGIRPELKTVQIISDIAKLKNLEIEGIFTHLALLDEKSDKMQFDLFMKLIKKIETTGIHIPIKHVCDSIGMLIYPEYLLDMVRVGAFLYGVRNAEIGDPPEKNSLSLVFKTKVAQIKEIDKGQGVGYDRSFIAERKSLIGTLPVGYADGYLRNLSNKAEVSIRGKKARIIGRICMDECMIDLTDIPDVVVGDEVVLIGKSGCNCIPIDEVADKAGTNRNEIVSVISRRVPRVYIKDGHIVDIVDYVLD